MNYTTLTEIYTDLESGSRPKGGVSTTSGDIPTIGAEHLNNTGTINSHNLKYIEKDFFASMKHGHITTEDILIVKDGATTGKVAFVDDAFPYKKAAINEHVFRVAIDKNKAIPKYVFYFLSSSLGKQQIMSDFRGATVGGISRQFADKIKVPLPDIAEQKRIVAILNLVSSFINTRKESIKHLDDFLRSTFLEMFGDPRENNKKWDLPKLGDICSKITDGTHKTPKYKNDGIRFVSAKNIIGNHINWDQIKYISKDEHSALYRRCNPQKGDIVLTKSGSIGTAALVDVDFEFSMFESLALIKYNPVSLNGYFLRDYLNMDSTKLFYSSSVKGISIRHLHLVDIRRLPLICPPLKLQNEYATTVEQVESTKQKMKESLEQMSNCFNALMQRYFG